MDEHERLSAAVERMPDLRVGEQLCLDFANSVEPRGVALPVRGSFVVGSKYIRDYLAAYDDLVGWGRWAGVLTDAEAIALLREADRKSEHAAAVMNRAITLRETIYRVFWRVAHGGVQDPDDLAVLSREHAEAARHRALVAHEDGFAWTWQTGRDPLESILWPVAVSATSLLTSADLTRVKMCPGVPGDPVACAWLFYDTSKSRTRHWCSMEDCGGVVKARRQNARRRATRTLQE